jgi:hypothetical protein
MAIAPVNKFITIAVPVAPGEQTIYSTPTGVSAIILYAQVSNVATATTYPSITFTHRRKSNRTGNVRNIRILRGTEVPPNDNLIIIDGRLVLERTALISDSVVIEGTQAGIVTVTNCLYDNNTGITTVTTLTPHNFSAGSEITMSGLAFTCSPGTSGVTTTIYPSPQASFTVTSITGNVGTSLTFTTNTGSIAGIAHTYVSGGKVAPLQMEFICSILENSTV